jgi:hypothetical protein
VLDALAVTYCDAYRPRVVYRKKAAVKPQENPENFDSFIGALMLALKPFDEARTAFVRVLREKLGYEARPG